MTVPEIVGKSAQEIFTKMKAKFDAITPASIGAAPDSLVTTNQKGLMSAEDKSKLDGIETGATATAIDKTLSKSGEAADAKVTGENVNLLKELISGVDAPVYRTASGNSVTFADGYDNATLKSCVVAIPPTQDGTPSVETPVPISGYSGVTVQRTGKNLLNFSGMSSGSNIRVAYSSDGNSFTYTHLNVGSGHSFTRMVDLTAFIGRTVTVSVEDIVDGPDNANDDYTGYLRIRGRDATTATGTNAFQYDLYNIGPYGFSKTVTITERSRYLFVQFAFRNASAVGDVITFVKPQVEIGDEQTAYEPHREQSVNIPFVDADNGGASLTVYGGTVNVISSALTVTHGNIASYDGETVPDGWFSSTGQLSTGAQVVYPLATPVTYPLTPVSLTSLHGYNFVFADAGSLSVTYRADVGLAYEELTNAILSLGGNVP